MSRSRPSRRRASLLAATPLIVVAGAAATVSVFPNLPTSTPTASAARHSAPTVSVIQSLFPTDDQLVPADGPAPTSSGKVATWGELVPADRPAPAYYINPPGAAASSYKCPGCSGRSSDGR
jgi:hypothetical protein